MDQRETAGEEAAAESAEPAQEKPVAAMTPALGRGVPQVQAQQIVVDAMPADRAALARMTPDQRSAIYLNQIRKMLIFFTVLTVIGLVTGLIVGIVGINAIHQATCTGFGC